MIRLFGGVAEWLKAADSKSVEGSILFRGFESYLLRQSKIWMLLTDIYGTIFLRQNDGAEILTEK